MRKNEIKKLAELSVRARIYTLAQIYLAQSGHPGGSLSVIDILVFLFYIKYKKKLKCRIILSKGHAAPAIYSVACLFNLISKRELNTFRQMNSPLQGHTDSNKHPWLETSSGSLGQGISFSSGLALSLKKEGEKIFCIIGDGEMQEGIVWESLMFSNKFKLNNLSIILDYNKIQSDDFVKNIMNIEPIYSKLKSFGFNVKKINGHSFTKLKNIISSNKNKKPNFVIADTIKGKGIHFMENFPAWHGSVAMSKFEIKKSFQILGVPEKKIEMFLKKRDINFL